MSTYRSSNFGVIPGQGRRIRVMIASDAGDYKHCAVCDKIISTLRSTRANVRFCRQRCAAVAQSRKKRGESIRDCDHPKKAYEDIVIKRHRKDAPYMGGK